MELHNQQPATPKQNQQDAKDNDYLKQQEANGNAAEAYSQGLLHTATINQIATQGRHRTNNEHRDSFNTAAEPKKLAETPQTRNTELQRRGENLHNQVKQHHHLAEDYQQQFDNSIKELHTLHTRAQTPDSTITPRRDDHMQSAKVRMGAVDQSHQTTCIATSSRADKHLHQHKMELLQPKHTVHQGTHHSVTEHNPNLVRKMALCKQVAEGERPPLHTREPHTMQHRELGTSPPLQTKDVATTNDQVAHKGNHNRSPFDNNTMGSDQQSAETFQTTITDDLRRQLQILRDQHAEEQERNKKVQQQLQIELNNSQKQVEAANEENRHSTANNQLQQQEIQQKYLLLQKTHAATEEQIRQTTATTHAQIDELEQKKKFL